MSIVNLLGGHTLFGGLITILAGIAWLTWDYSRMDRSGRFIAYVLTTRRIAITLTVISIIFMGARFVSVASSFNQ
ncbi:hypothetical protein EAS64_07285 [Trebonia kvetii]|uniref:Uncharacterized protein n=1 Tax=Trebonia kvetii TaxID=2480626 RepID=A0A6P2C6Q2_9ACTN|nr:hypothetical protein [Trebonia kvetii]TVZ07109.1 hypothetical protein EAS64_07285 [Trebonia kvetii]